MPHSIPGFQLVIPGPDWKHGPDLPDETAKIRRYINLAKLTSILQKKALFLSRLDLLGDPLEGSWSKASTEYFRKHVGDEDADRLSIVHKVLKKRSWVSCWHCADSESEALWRLYSPDNQGIAIQSTVGRLVEAIPPVSTYQRTDHGSDLFQEVELSGVSRVRYVDYSKDGPHLNNTIGPLLCKRVSFAHEKELRAIVQLLPLGIGDRKGLQNAPEGAKGLYRNIQVEKFIQNIYIDPLAPDWFLDLVKDLVRQYRFVIPVRRSDLWSDPIHFVS